MKQVKRIFEVLLLSALVLISAAYAGAVQDLIALQGSAKNLGVNINSGNITIDIYDQPSGGSLVYNETFTNVISSGYFDVVLGQSNTMSLEYGKIYYLDMSINGQSLNFSGSPRQMFESGNGLVGGQFIKSGAVNSTSIADGSIMDVDISGSASIAKSKISSSSTWAESDIPSLSSGWSGTVDYSRIANAGSLNINNSNYLQGHPASDFLNNDSSLQSKITSINTTSNILSLGFNTTTQLNTLYYSAGNPSGYVATGVAVLTNFYNKTDADARYLQLTDQRFNDTSIVNTANTNAIQANTTATQANTTATSALNTANGKASPASCASGQVVQNTTTGGVQCVTASTGTVTSINATAPGLTGGFITTTGSIALNTTYTDTLYLGISDQRYNDTAKINGVNTSANMLALGFNTTTQLNNLYYASNNPSNYITAGITVLTNFYNKTDTDVRYGGKAATNVWSGNNVFTGETTCFDGNSTCFNSTSNVWSSNDTWNITGLMLGYNTTAQLDAKYLLITDQRYNDTALANTANTNAVQANTTANGKAGPANCGSGQVAQNTTTGGVQCVNSSGIAPIGINGAIQYSNNGVTSGSTKATINSQGFIQLSNSSDPTPPNSGAVLFSQDRGNESIISYMDSSGYDKFVQPHIAYDDIGWYQPAHTSVAATVPIAVGLTVTAPVGTITNPAVDGSSVKNTMIWSVSTSAAVINSYAEFKGAGLNWLGGNSSLPAANGGYEFAARFNVPTVGTTNNTICIGMFNSINAFTNVLNCFTGATNVNSIFVGVNSSLNVPQTTLRIWAANSTTLNQIVDCGANYPIGNITAGTTAVYEMTMRVLPSNAGASVYVDRLDNTSILPCVAAIPNGKMPLGTVPLTWHLWNQNGGYALAVTMGMNKVYLARDY